MSDQARPELFLTRRELLRRGAGTAAVVAGIPLLAACQPSLSTASGSPPANAAASSSAAAASAAAPSRAPFPSEMPAPEDLKGSINFMQGGSSADFDTIIAEFNEFYPNVTVSHITYPSGNYHQVMAANFLSGNPRVDVVQTEEDPIGSWIKAGFVQPIQGLPGWEKYPDLMYSVARDDCTYDGTLYSLPHYSGLYTFVANKALIQKAGFSAPPKTIDEYIAQAKAGAAAGMATPLVGAFVPGRSYHAWYALLFASGGRMFDAENNPVFDKPDSIAFDLLSRIADLIKTGLMDKRSTQWLPREAKVPFATAEAMMMPTNEGDIGYFSDATTSKVVDDYVVTDVPSLTGKEENSYMFQRQYLMGARTENPLACWALMQFMGGQNPANQGWEGQKYIAIEDQNRTSYAVVNEDDPEVVEFHKKLKGEPALPVLDAQAKIGRIRDGKKTPWNAEWHDFHMRRAQEAMLGTATVADALTASAQKARDLKSAS